MHVPQELVDLIIDNLHGDVPSLKSCSLAARTSVASAQTYIFKKIEILPPTPDLIPPSLRLSLTNYTSCWWAPRRLSRITRSVSSIWRSGISWVMSGRTLSPVLPLLDLKRISLIENAPVEWNGNGEFSMDWNSLGRVLNSALAAAFSSPTLESVHLRGIVVGLSGAAVFTLQRSNLHSSDDV
ncbi:hypothetical protein B0H14DRAFT_3875960 [Mycena olivaceomarginata]|nr:hypothetical protein B0H14DRAFT_3875960 [Mycena olivaceomarginata]